MSSMCPCGSLTLRRSGGGEVCGSCGRWFALPATVKVDAQPEVEPESERPAPPVERSPQLGLLGIDQ